ncbi:hypothetical protein KPH14_009019 [Odynerus spinipes]|uniref:Peptidase S1 domain-containing protein n=1 Tax=Odynerus spinipes TaxID=1348599 RepID=A0AAD9VQ78_9HYME|nr:hypothetical protein KPH14_009019 [Odynerus spinipes]
MRTPLRMLLIALISTAYANGLPYSQVPDYFSQQQSVQWYDDKQEQQQQQDNSFFNTVPHISKEQEIAQIGAGLDQSNSEFYNNPSDIHPSLIPQNSDVSDFISFPVPKEEPINGVGLTVSCSGENKFCVHKDHCINGYAQSVKKEFIYNKREIQQCNLQYEVCCIVKDYHEQSPSDVGIVHVPSSEPDFHVTDQPTFVQPAQVDQHHVFVDFGSTQGVESPVENGVEQTVGSPGTDFLQGTDIGSGVATSPPLTESSGTSFEEAPKEAGGSDIGAGKVEPPLDLPSSGSTGFQAPVQLGCAAALLCVEERFCTKEGVISTEPVVFTEKDLLRRVPLSNCKDTESGIIGKCCRDPNYVDPWPTGNLPANYSGGFDEQGFPTFLNIAKVRPPKKQISGTKTVPTVKSSIPNNPRPPVSTQFQPNKFSTVRTTTIGEPIPQYVDNHKVPEFSANMPQQVTVRPFPSPNPSISIETPSIVPRPFSTNPYESEVQNSAPIIPQHRQNECGVRNNVPHTDKLDKPVTSFGEIPWQAMILSNEYRTILCSGVIVAPNIVLTTAYCVNGFRPHEIAVKSGEWKLGYELKHEEPLPFEITNVTSIVIHPNYVLGSSVNDLAALFLEHAVAYDAHVNPLCMPNLSQTHKLNKCIVTGWGQAVIKVHALGAVMNSLDVNILPHDVCTQHASQQQYNIDVEYGTVCVKPQNINHNMCQTEIGAPLACERENGVYELAGLYSQDNGCSPTHQVAVFTSINNEWLSKIMHNTEQSTSPTLNVKDDSYDYRQSNLPSAINQYLPPV